MFHFVGSSIIYFLANGKDFFIINLAKIYLSIIEQWMKKFRLLTIAIETILSAILVYGYPPTYFFQTWLKMAARGIPERF